MYTDVKVCIKITTFRYSLGTAISVTAQLYSTVPELDTSIPVGLVTNNEEALLSFSFNFSVSFYHL